MWRRGGVWEKAEAVEEVGDFAFYWDGKSGRAYIYEKIRPPDMTPGGGLF